MSDNQIRFNSIILQRNLPFLTHNTCNLSGLLLYLVSKEIITVSQSQSALKKSNDEEAAKEMYLILMKKVTHDIFQQFLEGLEATNNSHVIDVLEESIRAHDEDENNNVLVKSPILDKWWPDKKILMNSFLERKTGDKLLVEQLKEMLYKNEVKTTIVAQKATVSGMGGIGKTTTAKWFADKYEDEFSHIIWLDCGEGSMNQAMLKFAKTLKITVDDDSKMDDFVPTIYKELINIKCLFIFDNVDDYTGVREFLPKNSMHYTLITSRQQSWGSDTGYGRIDVLRIDVFSRTDSVQFIKNSTINNEELILSDNETESIENVAHQLGDLPLALQVAVATMNEMNWKPSTYLQELRRNLTEILLKGEMVEDYDRSINNSLRITIDVIVAKQKEGDLVNEILDIFAFLAPDSINGDLIIQLVNKMQSEIDVACNILQKYSLITSSNGVYSIHRLLQHVLRLRLTKIDASNVLTKLLARISKVDEKLRSLHENHIWSLWNYGVSHDSLIDGYRDFFISVVKERSAGFKYDDSLEFFYAAFIQLNRIVGPDHVITLGIRFEMADSLFKLEQYEKAEEFWRIARNNFPKWKRLFCKLSPRKAHTLKRKCSTAAKHNMKIVQKIKSGETSGTSQIMKVEFDEEITSEAQLCKKVTQLINLGKLTEAWREWESNIESCMKRMDTFSIYETSSISLAGLKLLSEIYRRRLQGTETEERRLEVDTFLNEGTANWIKINRKYWNWNYWDEIVVLADKIALELIEQNSFGKVTDLYSNLLTRICWYAIDFETWQGAEFQPPGVQILQNLNHHYHSTKSNSNSNVKEAIKYIDCITTALQVHKYDRNSSWNINPQILISENQKNYVLNGTTIEEMVTFSKFIPTDKPNILTTINFKHIQFYKCELVQALRDCRNLQKLILQQVEMIGGCRERAYLPNLKEFIIHLVHWDSWVGLQIYKKYELKQVINSISFFYKALNNIQWQIEEAKSLDLDTYSVTIQKENVIHITKLDISHPHEFCWTLNRDFADEVFKSVHFKPDKFVISTCKVSLTSIIRSGDTLKHLILHRLLDFSDLYVTELELSTHLLNHFPNLEILEVTGCNSLPLSLRLNNLPPKLIKLKLISGIRIIFPLGRIMWNKFSSINMKITEHTSLTQLFLIDVSLHKRNLSGIISSYFPNLEVLEISAQTGRLYDIEMSLLPTNLTQLTLTSMKIIPMHGFETPAYNVNAKLSKLKQVKLTDVSYPDWLESANRKLRKLLFVQLPNLEILEITGSNFSPICLDIYNLPPKLIQLKLSKIQLSLATPLTNVTADEHGHNCKYEFLKHLCLTNITVKLATAEEIELTEILLKYIPNLENLAVHVSENSTPFSIRVYNMPPKLTKLRVFSTRLIYDLNNLRGPLQLKTVSLEYVRLPSEGLKFNSFFNAISKVFIGGSSNINFQPMRSVERLVEIASIQLICVGLLFWNPAYESPSLGFEKLMHKIGIQKSLNKLFCVLERIHGDIRSDNDNGSEGWNGRVIDEQTFNSMRTQEFNFKLNEQII